MAVRRALGFIQVGGEADGAADAAPSPARCARGRRSQAHAPSKQTDKQTRKRGGRGAVPLNRLGSASAFPAAHRFLLCLCCVFLCYFRETCDHFRARLSDVLSVDPAPEAVKEQELSVLQSIRAYDVIVHDIRYKILIKPSRIDEFASRFFDILHQILYHFGKFGGMTNRTEFIPPEFFCKEGILLNGTHFLCPRIIVAQRFYLARQCAVGDIEDPVKMQSVRISAAFPCPNI